MLKLQKLKQNFIQKHTAGNIQLVDPFGSFLLLVFFVSRDFPMIPLQPEKKGGGVEKFSYSLLIKVGQRN